MGDEKKDEDKPLSVWKFLNSSFALWLLSAVFITGIGSAFTQWQAQTAEDRKNKEQIERIDLEISYRFSELLLQIDDLRTSVRTEVERAKEVTRLYCESNRLAPWLLVSGLQGPRSSRSAS
jgi:hypothetical protein